MFYVVIIFIQNEIRGGGIRVPSLIKEGII
jgi:hypothetical protein